MGKHVLGALLTGDEIGISSKASGKGIGFPLPAGYTVDGRAITFVFDGLTWTFTLTKTGSKLETTVAARRGAQTYQFNYARIGGANALQLDAAGNLVSDEFVLPRPYAISAAGKRYDGSWSVNPARATLSFDDTQIPDAEFPYVLDPTSTFNVAASGDDGNIVATDASYPPAADSADTTATAPAIARAFLGGFYEMRMALVRWDTSSVPDDATVTAATLRLWITYANTVDARSLTAGWYAGSNWPIDTSDYTDTAETGAHSGTALGSLSVGADNDLALSDLGSVNKTGYTGLRLHVSGGQPTGENWCNFASFDHATLTEPRLIIDYELPTILYPHPPTIYGYGAC